MTNTTNEETFLVDEQIGGGGLEQHTKIGEEEATKKDQHQNDLQMGKGTTFKSSANDAKVEMTKFKVYTKTGDDGTSSLYNLERRKKSDLTFEALGDCDETNVAVGIARVHARDFFLFNNTNNNSDATTITLTLNKMFYHGRLFRVAIGIRRRFGNVTPMTSEKTKDGMKMRCRFDESHVDAINLG